MPRTSPSAPDPALQAAPPETARAGRWSTLLVGGALFMQMLDATVISVALPVMARSLDTTALRLNLAVTAYLLVSAMFVPASGWVADRFGARRVFQFAIGLFVISSLLCAMSGSVAQLVGARIVQGLAGALMVPVGRIILLRTVERDKLLGAISMLSVPALVAPLIGPPVGGFIATYLSWHWIFLINLPVGVYGLILVRRHIRPDPPGQGHAPLDLVGFVLIAVAITCTVIGLEAIGQHLVPLGTALLLLLAGAASAAAYRHHALRSAHPILNLRLLRVRTFAASALAGNLNRLAIGAMPFLLAMQLQVVFGHSAVSAGSITFIGAAGALAGKPFGAAVVRRLGFRRVLIVASLLVSVELLLCALFRPDTPVWWMAVVLGVGGFIQSFLFSAINALAYADLPARSMSNASAIASMVAQLGIGFGVAAAAAVLDLSAAMGGRMAPDTTDVMIAYGFVALLCAAPVWRYLRLKPDAGRRLMRAETPRS